MRLSRRAFIALSIMLGAIDARAQSHIRENLLRVNAYDDAIEARRLDEARAEQRRLDEHREEAHREEAHREEEHRDEAHREETRREARIHAYNAWLQRMAATLARNAHDRSNDAMNMRLDRSLLVARSLLFASASLASVSAHADCFDDAAAWQHLNPLVLRAIAWQESHNNADATHANANGSIDYGVMQINSIHLPELARYGIRRDALMVPCKNVYIAAWHLRKQVVRYGNTWKAVGAYHSSTPALRDDYARRIAAIIDGWRRDPAHGIPVTAASLAAR